MIEPANRGRLLGWALVAHGAAGLALAVAGLLFVAGATGTVRGLTGSLEDQRVALVGWLETTSRTFGDAGDAAGRATGSLAATADAANDAALLTRDLGTTMRQLASAVQLEVFGTRPFGALEGDFTRVAERAEALAADLEEAALSLQVNQEDSRRLAADFSELQVEIDRLRTLVDEAGPLVETGDAFASSRVILVGLLAWVALGATISLVAGLWLVRRPMPDPRSVSTSAEPGAARRHG